MVKNIVCELKMNTLTIHRQCSTLLVPVGREGNKIAILGRINENHRQLIDRYLTDFSHASSYRKILRAMRILCGNQNAMVIAFCRFCNIIKLQFLYYFKNNVSRAKKL